MKSISSPRVQLAYLSQICSGYFAKRLYAEVQTPEDIERQRRASPEAVVMRLLVARGSLTQDPVSKAHAKRKWPPFADQQGEV